MKVRLSMPGASVSMEYDDSRAKSIFQDLAGRLIGAEGSGTVRIPPAITCNISAPVSDQLKQEIQEALEDSVVTVMESEESEEPVPEGDDSDLEDEVPELTEAGLPVLDSQGYKGFLHIRCESCGKERTFCAKEPLESHLCSCGHETPLNNLYDAWVHCECGRRSRYKTNSDEYIFNINCLCGSPVPVKWNKVKRNYETIK